MSILLATVAANSVALNGGTSLNVVFDPSDATAQVEFTSEGLITNLSSGSTKWYAVAPLVGVGNDYEIMATRTDGSLPVGTVDTWLALSSNRNWQITQDVVGEKTSTLLIKIRTLSGAVIAEGTYQLTARVRSNV